ncbi:ABC transporter substrate-binding protein [Owenweeksia hongkongensis]|uniref:ABC transporter substrate-binding protein n=1 Tax=Owenweeksia hongkongensis TaxID=253245 RepID=UPI003A93D63E
MRYTLFSFLFLLLACSPQKQYDDTLIFRYNEAAGITSLDPAFSRNQANIWAVNQLFNGLVQMDDDLKVQPCIAKSWEISDSGMTYTFHLRDDVLFHANECFENDEQRRVVAEDFKYSFERVQSTYLAAPGSWVFANVLTFDAPDDSTFVIYMKQPFPPFLGILSMKYCSVVPEEAVNYYGNSFREKPVGTGPFYFKIWAENEKLVLRKNIEYFEKDEEGNSLPYLESVAISFIPDKQSAFLEFIKGNLDLISGIDASYKDELLTHTGELQERYAESFNLYRQPYLNTEYLAFLVDSSQTIMEGSPILDVRIRQAINYGFDRKKMMRYLRNNIGEPANYGMIPRGLASFDTSRVVGYDYNPEKAKALLAEAGYPNGAGLPPIKLQTNASYLDLCEYIQGEVAGIGIKMEVEVTPPSTLRQSIATSKVPFFRASWIGDYPDGENYLSLFYSENWAPNGPNYTHFKNPVFDSLYQRATAETNDSNRMVLYSKMDSLVMAQAPVVPLYYDQVLRFYPNTVSGLGGNAMNLLDLKRVRKGE